MKTMTRLFARTTILSVLCLISSACLTGCSGNDAIHKQLAEADRLIESEPETSLRILQEIDTNRLKTEENWGKYAMLISYANIRNSIFETDTTLTRLAVKWYRKKDDPSNLMRALFCDGFTSYNIMEFRNGMSKLLEAEKIANDLDDPYWLAKIIELQGDIFSNTYNFEESRKRSLLAAQYYKESNRELNHRYAMVDYAQSHSNTGNQLRGLEIIDSINAIADADSCHNLMFYCERAKFPIFYELKKYKEAKVTFVNALVNGNPYLQSAQDYAKLSEIAISEDSIRHAYEYLLTADSLIVDNVDKLNVKYAWQSYFRKVKNFDMYSSITDTISNLEISFIENYVKESVLASERDYFENRTEEEALRAERREILVICLSVVFLVVCISGIIIHRLRLRAKKAELKEKINDVILLSEKLERMSELSASLSEGITAKENEMKNMKMSMDEQKKLIADLFKHRWRNLNILCTEYFEKEGNENMEKFARGEIEKKIEKEIKKVHAKDWVPEVEMSVNLYMNGIIRRLREQCPSIKNDDIMLLTLVMAGFTAKAVCLLLNLKTKNFYAKKSRLSKKISESDASDKEEFLAAINRFPIGG